jgi:hypothetical protein
MLEETGVLNPFVTQRITFGDDDNGWRRSRQIVVQ